MENRGEECWNLLRGGFRTYLCALNCLDYATHAFALQLHSEETSSTDGEAEEEGEVALACFWQGFRPVLRLGLHWATLHYPRKSASGCPGIPRPALYAVCHLPPSVPTHAPPSPPPGCSPQLLARQSEHDAEKVGEE